MAKNKFTITVGDLLDRPVIREDYTGHDVWMNKMTDKELAQWDKEAYAFAIAEGTPNKFPDLNAAHLSKHIDRGILYKLMTSAK